jgi:hypothetical protein
MTEFDPVGYSFPRGGNKNISRYFVMPIPRACTRAEVPPKGAPVPDALFAEGLAPESGSSLAGLFLVGPFPRHCCQSCERTFKAERE